MKRWLIWSLAGLLLLVVAAVVYFFLPSRVIVPDEKVAVVVPASEITPGVPRVIFIGVTTIPLDLAENQGVINNVVITFSEAMNPATVNENTFILTGPNNADIKGLITPDTTGKVWTFNPTDTLLFGSEYNVRVTTGAKGVSGNSLVKDFVWSFTTNYASGGGGGGSGGSTPTPVILALTRIALSPASKTLNVTSTQQLTAAGLDQNDNPIVATINYTTSNSSVAVVNASGFVTAVAAGSATITARNGMITNTSIITVVTAGAECPAVSVDLGSSDNFVILSETGITDVPISTIIGNIGTYPITGAAMTGITCSEITGSVYDRDGTFPHVSCLVTNDALLLAAVNDMETAYANANLLAACVSNLGTGDIGGMVLAPGSYEWNSGVTIPTDVTLSGNATDVWVFQISGALGLSANKHVILTGGALASNVYWVATGATTLGANSVFAGNILDGTAVTFGADAALNGRALAQTAVTLSSNNITEPAD